jgi:fido (protein-threonine AMPylation protein)
VYNLFSERFKQALIHRRLLSEKFGFRGRGRFEEMAKGKRFFYLQDSGVQNQLLKKNFSNPETRSLV